MSEKKPGVVTQLIQYLNGFSLLRSSTKSRSKSAGSPSATDEEQSKSNGDHFHSVAKTRKPGGWKTMPYIISNETFERVASYGLTANLTVYLLKEYHLRQADIVNFSNIFNGTTNFAPLIGAFVADAYWGKFKVLAYACIASLLGMVVMSLTAAVPSLQPPDCSPEAVQLGRCSGPSAAQMGVLILALSLHALGAAGVRPCSLPFGMDQFDRGTEEGRKGTNTYFNWYYATNTASVMVAMTLVVYLQDSVSWTLGFGVSALLMLLAVVLFFVGTRFYIYVPAEGSIFSDIVKVLVGALKKRSLELPSASEQEATLYNPPRKAAAAAAGPATAVVVTRLPLTQQFRFLNKAAVVVDGDLDPADGSLARPWRLSTVQRIEEVKCLIRVIPVWASGITCFVAIGQQFTYAVLQSLTMDRHLGPHFEIPPGSMGAFCLLAICLFLPVYDRVLVPAVRRVTKKEEGITLLQRMGVGIVISVVSMVVAGTVERKRRESALSSGTGVGGFMMSPMSALWLVPQLALVGVSEAFNAVGQIEFYNQQFPDQMRSLATSLFSCSLAGAGYLSATVVTLVSKNTANPNWLDNNINAGRVDYFYFLLAAMGGVNLVYFLIVSHYYHYKGVPDHQSVQEEEEKEEENRHDHHLLLHHHGDSEQQQQKAIDAAAVPVKEVSLEVRGSVVRSPDQCV